MGIASGYLVYLGFPNLLHRGATSWRTPVLCLPDAHTQHCTPLLSSLILKPHHFHQPSNHLQCWLLGKHATTIEIFHYFTKPPKSQVLYPWQFSSRNHAQPPGSSHLLHCLMYLCLLIPPPPCASCRAHTHTQTQLWLWMDRQGADQPRWSAQSSSRTPKQHSWQKQRHLHMQTCSEAPAEAPRDRQSTNPPSLTSFPDRQMESNTQQRPCHSSVDTRAPTWTCLWSSHTSAGHELPTAAGGAAPQLPRGSPSPVGTDRSIALVANGDWAMQSLWSDTGRGKGEGKRTLWTKEKSGFLSHQGEGGHMSSFPSDSGSDCFSFITLGTVAQHKLNSISSFDTEQQTVMSNFLCLEEETAGC